MDSADFLYRRHGSRKLRWKPSFTSSSVKVRNHRSGEIASPYAAFLSRNKFEFSHIRSPFGMKVYLSLLMGLCRNAVFTSI